MFYVSFIFYVTCLLSKVHFINKEIVLNRFFSKTVYFIDIRYVYIFVKENWTVLSLKAEME